MGTRRAHRRHDNALDSNLRRHDPQQVRWHRDQLRGNHTEKTQEHLRCKEKAGNLVARSRGVVLALEGVVEFLYCREFVRRLRRSWLITLRGKQEGWDLTELGCPVGCRSACVL